MCGPEPDASERVSRRSDGSVRQTDSDNEGDYAGTASALRVVTGNRPIRAEPPASAHRIASTTLANSGRKASRSRPRSVSPGLGYRGRSFRARLLCQLDPDAHAELHPVLVGHQQIQDSVPAGNYL